MAETTTFPTRLETPLRPVGLETRQSPAPWLAFGITLLLTFAASGLVAFAVDGRDSARFDNATQSTVSEVRVRLETYVAVLRGADGFFAASESVDHDEFREYAAHLNVQRHFPGIQGIGFARRMERDEIRDLVEDMRALGLPFFAVRPLEPARADFFPIVYLEPQDRRNRAALGYDMFSDSVRREAMERARDKGAAAISGRVRLVQELDEPDPQPGFLIYHPVYSDGTVPATVEERRRLITGFVYAPFRARDLFDAIVPNSRRNQLAFRVMDGPDPATASLLYDSERMTSRRVREPSYSTTDTLTLAGRTWTIGFETLPAFDQSSGQPLVPLIAVVGVLVSFVLFRVMRSQVLARAKAERIEATRSRFFAAMSHELRTPINAILGYNDLLLSGVYGALPPAQAHGVERSQKAARHLAELVNDVLDLSKIEAGKVRLDFESVRVADVIEDLLTTIRPVAEERGCTLNIVPCECEGRILTDPRRVRQILLNLLSNATKFGAGHPIAVRLTDVDQDGGVLVEVTDRGPGIAHDDLDRIFEEFVQLERGTQEGTGLGLAISRRLASLLGGHLDVESLPGSGSTFRLHLPAHPPRITG
jgi:signal transduction histidine kinase